MALKDKLRLLMSVKDTPHRLALAFSSGVFIGMSPLLGIHTILGIIVSSVFRLNRLATLAGVFITNPWTIIPIYTFSTWLGAKCIGVGELIPSVDWNSMTAKVFLNEFSHLLLPFVLGSFLVGAVSSLISYLAIYYIARKKHG